MQVSICTAYVSMIGAPTSATICGPQRLALLGQRLLELAQAPLPQLGVARPVRLVERPPGRGDRALHVVGARVGDRADDFLGRRVDVVVARSRRRLDELAVDQHPVLAGHRLPHDASPSFRLACAAEAT